MQKGKNGEPGRKDAEPGGALGGPQEPASALAGPDCPGEATFPLPTTAREREGCGQLGPKFGLPLGEPKTSRKLLSGLLGRPLGSCSQDSKEGGQELGGLGEQDQKKALAHVPSPGHSPSSTGSRNRPHSP